MKYLQIFLLSCILLVMLLHLKYSSVSLFVLLSLLGQAFAFTDNTRGGGPCSLPRCGQAVLTCSDPTDDVTHLATTSQEVEWGCSNTCGGVLCSEEYILRGGPGGAIIRNDAPVPVPVPDGEPDDIVPVPVGKDNPDFSLIPNIPGIPGLIIPRPQGGDGNPNPNIPLPIPRDIGIPSLVWTALPGGGFGLTSTGPLIPIRLADDIVQTGDVSQMHAALIALYSDKNANGSFDSGEGLSGINIRVARIERNGGLVVLGSGSSDERGFGYFRLPVGDYTIQVADPTQTYTFTRPTFSFQIEKSDYYIVLQGLTAGPVFSPEGESVSPSDLGSGGIAVSSRQDEIAPLSSRVLDGIRTASPLYLIVRALVLGLWFLLCFALYLLMHGLYDHRWMRYVVQWDETIEAISDKHLMSVRQFHKHNRAIRTVHAGQIVWVRDRDFIRRSFAEKCQIVFHDWLFRFQNNFFIKNLRKIFAKH